MCEQHLVCEYKFISACNIENVLNLQLMMPYFLAIGYQVTFYGFVLFLLWWNSTQQMYENLLKQQFLEITL